MLLTRLWWGRLMLVRMFIHPEKHVIDLEADMVCSRTSRPHDSGKPNVIHGK
jgi:hypothetical protein